MIPKASQRTGGKNLATHLMNGHSNELVEVMDVRGAIAKDLHGAFEEWEVLAKNFTKCKQFLYSLSINPDHEQRELTSEELGDYISRIEGKLGLTDQPRAMVKHIKDGREHYHLVWSRTLVEEGKAVHFAFDHDKLMMVTREFAKDHNLELPDKYFTKEKGKQKSLYELELERQSGLTTEDHKARITESWFHSDSAKAFVNALAEQGYVLAKGRRDYVVIDFYGGEKSLARMIDDKDIKIKQVRERLGKDYPSDELPSVEYAKKLVAEHREQIERFVKDEAYYDALKELKSQQADRRSWLEKDKAKLQKIHSELKQEFKAKLKRQRDELRLRYLREVKAIKEKRALNKRTGLADFLGKVSGVNAIRHKLHKYQDRQKLDAHLKEKKEINKKQEIEVTNFKERLQNQAKELERKSKALDAVEKKEIASLHKEHKREYRILARGQHNEMPSLKSVEKKLSKNSVEIERSGDKELEQDSTPDLLAAFDKAREDNSNVMPDLLDDFERAAEKKKKKAKAIKPQKRLSSVLIQSQI